MSQSFQKNQAKQTSKKQLAILGVLSLVLLGAVAHYGMGQGPQPASADQGGGDVVPTPKHPRDAIKELMADPTRTLLCGRHDATMQSEAAPHNPFAMAERWRSSLTRPEPVAEPVVQRPEVTPQPVYVAPTPRVHVAADTSGIKLQGIMRGARTTYAIVNGSIVKVGGTVGNLRVVEILDDRIRLVPSNEADAQPVEVTVKSKGR
jgi:hypothetical protein